MNLIIQFDQATSNLPAGFVSAVNYVASYFDTLFTNSATVTIDVGYGEIAGQALASNALGESEQTDVTSVSYSAVRSALQAEGAAGSSILPATSPAPGIDTLYMPSADQKALGLIPSDNAIDGYVGFDSAPNVFGYTIGSAPPPSEYYFVGVVEHEFTEIMGRTSYLDYSRAYSAMDLFRYSSAGHHQFTTGAASYFSTNGGTTNLDNWNNFKTGNSGDLGDWAPSAGNDAFDDNSNPGVVNSLSQTDVTLMNALSWTTGSQSPPPPANQSAANLREIGTGNFGASSSDVLWQASTGTPTIWQMNGNTATVATLTTPPSAWQIQGIGDFADKAGESDLVWHIPNGGAAGIWFMNGLTITSSVGLPNLPPNWNAAAVGDLYDTGYDNTLIWQNQGGATGEWLMSGANIAMTGALPTVASTDQIVGAGDYYDSGFNDTILLIDTVTNTPTLWHMNGSSIVVQATLPTPPAGAWHYRGSGNFFGDGHNDTLVWQDNDDDVGFWHMVNGNLALNILVASPGVGWNVVGVGDFNNNGYSDLLLQNSSGNTEIMYMQGTQVVSTAAITGSGNTSLMGSTELPDTVVGFGDVAGYPTFSTPLSDGTASSVSSFVPTQTSGSMYTPQSHDTLLAGGVLQPAG